MLAYAIDIRSSPVLSFQFRKLLKAHRIQCLLESGGIHRNVFKKIARVVHVIDDSLFASKQIIVIGLNDARD